jgi:beta-galactosidase
MTVKNEKESQTEPTSLSRRDFVRNCGLGALALATGPILGCQTAGSGTSSGPASWVASLDQDWLFGGKFADGTDQPGFKDATFSRVTLPHCVTKLSWQKWEPAAWQDVWIYRRHFRVPADFRHRRVFLDFTRVMTSATPVLNGHSLSKHLGGYLPFSYEVTDLLTGGDNVLAVKVDSTWQNVPPDGKPKGASGVDYLEPGGIPGSVSLRVTPQIFISDVFAKPVKVLDPDRSVQLTGSLDAALLPEKPVSIRAVLLNADKTIATASTTLTIDRPAKTDFNLALTNLGDIKLWEPDHPHLYTIVTTLFVDGQPVHDYRTRIGFREARFTADGFFLNGRRLRLFGLNRHEVYPYAGFAMPDRVMRRDAEILKHEYNCNIVRCSHYPQSEAFLDACDELGLMVWEETPGWGYLGDDAWKELVVRNVTDMVLRDRNHASIIIWGVRVNESADDVPLYQRTTAIAKSLDGTRACSGSLTSSPRKNWHEDVFALDDYHSAKDGSVGIKAPLPGVPYMLAETVGGFSYGKKGFNNRYRHAGELDIQMKQAVYHAQAHDRAAAYERFCGVIGWCAFDYSSLLNCFQAVKCVGVADVFRIPKLGASFYQAQVSPKIRPVIQPSFYWDFGPNSPRGPGKHAAIFSNCDRLEIFVAGKPHATIKPDREHYPHVKYAPSFCDLDVDGKDKPELRIDGYVDGQLVLTKSFSSDAAQDQLLLAADDSKVTGNGSDATRLVFQVADKFGQPRAFAPGEIAFELTGPGTILGDNPFSLEDNGGVGAVWIKSVAEGKGRITIKARHSTLGKKIVTINVS